MCFAPQVDRLYDEEQAEMQAEAQDRKRKRDEQQNSEPVVVKRHKLWLQPAGKRANLGSGSMRPMTIHRCGAKRYLQNMDNQIRVMTQHSGLVFLVRKPADPLWLDWRTWPELTIVHDLGSDGNTAYHAAAYKLQLNLIRIGDFAHGGNCDFFNALKATNLFQFWLLFLIVLNVPFGPDDDQGRLHQFREVLKHVFSTRTPSTTPVFQEFSTNMVKELEASGIVFSADDTEMELWNHCAARATFSREGSKVNLNRYQGSLKAAQRFLPLWSTHAFETIHTALELDFLKGKRLEERLVIKAGLAEHVGEGGGTTNPVRVTLEDRSLRSCCQNSVAIAALVLAGPNNQRVVSLIVNASESLLDWHTHQAQELRDVTRTSAWLLAQISGGIDGHINTILRSVATVKVLDKCGFSGLRPPTPRPWSMHCSWKTISLT